MERQIDHIAVAGNACTVEDFAEQIKSACADGVTAAIKVGRLLLEAKSQLRHGQWIDMVEAHLPFDMRTAERFMAIAENPILTNATHVSVLPPAWSTLYELSRLDSETLEAKIADGTINAGMERKDVAALKNPRGTSHARGGSQSNKELVKRNIELSSELEQKNAHIAELEAARDQAVTLETARTQYVDLVRALTANARKQEMKDVKALLSETA
jgi:Protein of unknown function (DUF3102)